MASNFSPEQIEELREAFKIFDKDGGGTISIDEIKLILEQRGAKVTDNDLKLIMAAVDEDKSGEIDFDEFVKMMSVVGCAPLSSRTSLATLCSPVHYFRFSLYC